VQCSIGMNQKEEKRIDRIQGTEIVLVLEERECMRAHKSKLVELVAKLGSSTPDARFGAIGFSGEGVHYEPHLFVNAGNGGAHLTGGEMKALMERQSFQSETGIEKSPMDPMAAIHFATEHFPFTMGTAKIIVLVTCQLCKHREMDQGDLLDALLHQNIILHVVTTKPIKTSEKTIEAVGFSADALFGKDGKEMAGREKLESPGDVCAIVAQETRGTVFSMRTMAGASMGAARIAAIKQVEQCEICHCHVQGFDTRPSCAPCNLVEPVSLSSQKFTGIAEFVDAEEEDETPSLF